MNYLRVLRCSNIFLLINGYQMHWFDVGLQSWRLSLAGAVNVFMLACIYAGCFAQHFQPSATLKTLLDVSPFLFDLTRLHLLLGVKVFSYAIFASVRAVGVASGLSESLPIRKADRSGFVEECVAYGLLFSTHFVLLCFGLYIGYEMEFKLPPLQDIMIGLALFLPHLVLAGALRFYCILSWVTCNRLRQLHMEISEYLTQCRQRNELEHLPVTTTTIEVSSSVHSSSTVDNLLAQCKQVQQLATRYGACFRSLQHSLLLLLLVNANCLLFGVYSYVFYSSTWHVLFSDRKHRIFYAGNACIYACISCDYLCLLLTHASLEQQRLRFLSSLRSVLEKREVLAKRLRYIVKDMRSVLWSGFHFKFLSIWRFNIANFSLLLLIQGLIIAGIVIFHYLDDGIQLLNENLEGFKEE